MHRGQVFDTWKIDFEMFPDIIHSFVRTLYLLFGFLYMGCISARWPQYPIGDKSYNKINLLYAQWQNYTSSGNNWTEELSLISKNVYIWMKDTAQTLDWRASRKFSQKNNHLGGKSPNPTVLDSDTVKVPQWKHILDTLEESNEIPRYFWQNKQCNKPKQY